MFQKCLQQILKILVKYEAFLITIKLLNTCNHVTQMILLVHSFLAKHCYIQFDFFLVVGIFT